MRTLLVLLFIALLPPKALASKCTFAADIFFEQDSATLDESGLKRAVHPIEVVRSQNTVLQYIVIGHADKSETRNGGANLLSLARAGAVAAQVLRTYPELKSVLYLEGKGATQPVSADPNKNRRVEIEVLCVVPPPYFDRNGKPIL